MERSKIQEEIRRLVHLIKYHNTCYFQKGISEISDYEYDHLIEQLVQLEKSYPDLKLPFSPTEEIGEYPSKALPHADHQIPMLSLDKTYSEAEIVRFVKRVQLAIQHPMVTFICEPKIDGVALSIVYEKGHLSRIITRGDGKTGDNITKNAQQLLNFPENIAISAAYLEIRGEAFMSQQTFEALNRLRKQNGEPLWANPRNITAGTLKALEVAQERQLNFYAYSLYSQPNPCMTQDAALTFLSELGFPIASTYKVCHDVSAIMDYIDYWEKHKQTLPVGIDGIVIKVNNLQQQQVLGINAKSPRWAIAYKYKPKTAHSILEKVIFQVGRTGMITPVAYFQPIPLAGTIVQRASLHNANEIVKKDLHIGDTILIEKGGDIIPQIIDVDVTQRAKETTPVVFITNCPACHTALLKDEEEVAYYCPNTKECPPQIQGKLLHFAHRRAMDIGCLGPKTIQALFEAKLVHNIADLYTLDPQAINKLDGFQELSTQKLLSNIHASKTKPFEKVLFALGIKHIGETVAQKLALHFKSMKQLQCASSAELLAVPDIGIKIAESMLAYAQDVDQQEIVKKLEGAGLQFVVEEKTISNQDLSGKKFVISGSFHQIAREELSKRIELGGGILLHTVSTKVDFLVIGDKPGPTKLTKAEALSIPILKENDIMKMIES